MEDWRVIDGYDGAYWVSDQGRVWSCAKGKRMLGLHRWGAGYLGAKLFGRRIGVHRLVLSTFSPTQDKTLEVNHKNGVKTDNRLENLEWCTRKENMQHAFKVLGFKGGMHGKPGTMLGRTGELCAVSRRVRQFTKEGAFVAEYCSITEASKVTKVGMSNISATLCKRKYRGTSGGFRWEYA